MGYRCDDCGNIDSFRATRNFTDYGHEELLINEEGEITDYLDTVYDDFGREYDSLDNITCDECDSENVEYTNDSYKKVKKKISKLIGDLE